MAWSWSHSPEAYSAAYDNLHNQPHDWLAECLAEWQASKPGQYGQRHLRLARWEKNLAWCLQLPNETLARPKQFDARRCASQQAHYLAAIKPATKGPGPWKSM